MIDEGEFAGARGENGEGDGGELTVLGDGAADGGVVKGEGAAAGGVFKGDGAAAGGLTLVDGAGAGDWAIAETESNAKANKIATLEWAIASKIWEIRRREIEIWTENWSEVKWSEICLIRSKWRRRVFIEWTLV